ncbi:GTP cyclohydrolase I FolE [Paenibacillus polymyxa]|uniref:GTP cyclohydrolase I FolE n=1 Tax=Paenibacillus polymyxa TaxID=1406 RepID=UPI002AB3E8A0|nr:GTP cyclohydrolase I FolE [Paenibacillus polymyxa]MDY8048842.1 GTP cyclohydrolase I FolE [Paenibacillus polymyxa]
MNLDSESLLELKKSIGLGHSFSDIKVKQVNSALAGITDLIRLCGDNPGRDELKETPCRVVKAFMEYTEGYNENPEALLEKSFDVSYDELVLVKDISFHSLCEHHFAPFYGKAHIAYLPQGNIITGLSKLARVVDAYAHRFQLQERMTTQIADTLDKVLKPLGVAVYIEAEHYCMCGRGIRKRGTVTKTSSFRGVYKDDAVARSELLAMIKC